MAVQYSEIQKLLRSRADLNAREAHEIRKTLRSIEKQLAAAGYSEDDLSGNVINNIAVTRTLSGGAAQLVYYEYDANNRLHLC